MKLEGTIYCEGPGCECSAHLGVATMSARRFVPGFLRVVEYGNSTDHEMAFCGWECAMRFGAQYPPPEIIPMGGTDG